MKNLLLVLALWIPFITNADADEATQRDSLTIKESNSTTTQVDIGGKSEVHTGEQDIEGDPSPLEKDAKASWKKACEDWKTQFRKDNKDSKIINLNCGKAECTGPITGKTCSSKGTFTIKEKN